MLNRSLVAGKFGLIPNRESVSVFLSRPGGESETITVSDAWRKPTKIDRIIAMGFAAGSRIEEWHIPDSQVNPDANGREIKPSNDSITDSAGDVWVVLHSELRTLRTVWVCTCQRQRQGANGT